MATVAEGASLPTGDSAESFTSVEAGVTSAGLLTCIASTLAAASLLSSVVSFMSAGRVLGSEESADTLVVAAGLCSLQSLLTLATVSVFSVDFPTVFSA